MEVVNMEKKAMLSVRAAVCDARRVTEETLSGYDKVQLRCGVLLTTPESREALEDLVIKKRLDVDGIYAIIL